MHAVARSTGHAGLQQVCSCSIQQTGVLVLQAGDHQSRALSKYTSLFGIINERKDNREYRGTMKIRRTIYLCTPHRLVNTRQLVVVASSLLALTASKPGR